MKALLSLAPGGPETLVLQDVPEPEPGPGEVRLKVAAVGVNYPDSLIIEDRYQFKPARPFAPGAEASGTIDRLGEGVSGLAIGDRVLASTGWGGMAEKVVLPARKC
ncbi:MAG: alcohol dehydrogenase catalytic domain-containing protein, partial [Methylobacteriaceae bacterium]|nr:alcohol dehydrogenase catalytic domain-containing protein [Methylobacteriaceae bacterium]